MQAIDLHVHVPREPGRPEIEIEAELLRYFRAPPPPSDPAAMAARFRNLDLFGVIFSVDTTTNTGEKPDRNDWVASFQNLQMGDNVIPKVLLENARCALNILA